MKTHPAIPTKYYNTNNQIINLKNDGGMCRDVAFDVGMAGWRDGFFTFGNAIFALWY